MDKQDQKEAVYQRRKAKKAECERRRRARMSDQQKAKIIERQRRRRAQMTEEEVKKRRIKDLEYVRKRRDKMTEEELKHLRMKDAEAQRRRLAKMTEEELNKVRIKNAECMRKRIAKMKLNEEELTKISIEDVENKRRKMTNIDEEELEKRRIENAEAQRMRIAEMSEDELKNQKIKDAESHRRRRAKMTEEELKKERIKNTEAQRRRFAKMTEEELNKIRIKDAESHRRRIAKMKMNEEEPADRLSQWRASQAAYQRRYRKQLKDESMKLHTKEGLNRFNIFLRRFTKSKSIKYARNFFSNILGEIGDLQEEIGSLKKQLQQSVSDAVQNAVKVHQIKKQTSGSCQSFTFVEIQMPTEPNKIIQHHLNRADNEIDPLFNEPDIGGKKSSGVCYLEGKSNGSVNCMDQIEQNYETFVVRPYAERVFSEEISEVNEGNKLGCLICSKKFTTSLGLTIHQKEHITHAKEFKCSVCPEFFKSYNLMTTHYLQFHSSYEDVEKEVESTQTDEELERGVHHSEFLVSKKCSMCFKTFDKERVGLSTYAQHIITDHSDNKELLKYFTYICSRCDKSHTFLHHLETHWKTNCFEKWKNEDGNNKQTIVCETCGIKFPNENSLSSHVKIFHSVKEKRKVICEQCGKEFGSGNTLSQHIALIHNGEYKFSCEHCGKKFKTQTRLKDHIQIVHLKVKPFVCKLCSKSFSNSSCLSTHLNTHTGEKPYKCKYCDKSFAARSALYVHEGVHTGFTCKMCNQSFGNYVELCGHRSQHHPTPNVADREKVGSDGAVEDPKQLKPTCEVCGKTFKTYSSMRTHKRVVHDGRKYICDVCGKISTSINMFNYHKNTHDNLSKRFGCNLCGKQFGQCTNFYQHRKVAHANQNAQIVKLTVETSVTSAEKVDKSTRSSIANKERILPELKSGHLSNPVPTSIENSDAVTNRSPQFAEDSNDIALDSNVDNSQGSENYSSDMDFADQDNEIEDNITSLQQFDPAELRHLIPENATSVCDDVQNSFCGSNRPNFEDATTSDHLSVPSSLNFNDFSRANVPLGLDPLTVEEAQPEIINANNVTEKTVDKIENKVFIEDFEENGFLANLVVDDLAKFKTEATLGGVYDDDQSVFCIQPYFSNGCSDNETAIKESNGNGKSWRNAEKIVSSPFEDNSPRLVVKLTRLLEYKCVPCDKTIFATSRREIRHHSRAHRATNIRPKKKKRMPSENIKCDFDCLYCEKKKLSSIQMIAHCSKEHPWQQPFQCNMCPKMFHNDDTLRRHKPQHNNDNYAGDPNVKPFWCELCLKEFKTVEDAKEHFEHFHQNKKFQCDICLFSCVKKTQLKNHKLRHSGIKSHLCDECGKAFVTPHELKDHVERVHRKIEKRKSRKHLKEKSSDTHPFTCHLCPYVFRKENGLKMHLKLHDPKRKNVCDECGLRFVFNANLLDHKLSKHTKNGKRNLKVVPKDA